MTKIKDISYEPTNKTIRFGFGNLWGDVYRHTEPLGRLPVGGRVGTVGPMLTPGGGLSHLSNRYGFSVDNVVSYEVSTGTQYLFVVPCLTVSRLYLPIVASSRPAILHTLICSGL